MFGYIVDFLAFIGLGHPIARAVSLASIGFAFQYFVQPGVSYLNVPAANNKTGRALSIPKEFYFTSKSENANMKTWMPWYMWPTLGALLGGFFI
jgi:hypothetical protein